LTALIQIDEPPPLPARPDTAHKGDFGTVIVAGGCRTMIGAPAFAAGAALRIGAGRAKLAVPSEILTAALSVEPGATGIALTGQIENFRHALDTADGDGQAVLAVGPGWGNDASHGGQLEILLAGARRTVLDADGLNALAARSGPRPNPGPPLILTPHPGEYRRLAAALVLDEDPIGEECRPAAAAALARAHRAVVVLKGHRTVVTDGHRLYVNQTGNPALATAGSGDVLTGAIAGLWAQSMTPFEAAVLATFLHATAADRWAQHYGPRGLTATTLLDYLAPAMQNHVCRFP